MFCMNLLKNNDDNDDENDTLRNECISFTFYLQAFVYRYRFYNNIIIDNVEYTANYKNFNT